MTRRIVLLTINKKESNPVVIRNEVRKIDGINGAEAIETPLYRIVAETDDLDSDEVLELAEDIHAIPGVLNSLIGTIKES